MMKLHSLLKSRVSISEKFANRSNKTLDWIGFNGLINRAGVSTYGQNVRSNLSNDRIYAPYSIYKGKAAFSAYPVPPQFGQLNSGGLTVKRQGCIMLNISPSIGERKYDWEKKQLFALSAIEVGSLINLGPKGSCEFFHDPAMKTSNAGQVRKSLLIKANPEGTGYFISLNVVNTVTKTNERLTIPVTSAEFAVMRTSFSFALPHIMGWDRYSSQAPKLEDKSVNKSSQGLVSEWDR